MASNWKCWQGGFCVEEQKVWEVADRLHRAKEDTLMLYSLCVRHQDLVRTDERNLQSEIIFSEKNRREQCKMRCVFLEATCRRLCCLTLEHSSEDRGKWDIHLAIQSIVLCWHDLMFTQMLNYFSTSPDVKIEA